MYLVSVDDSPEESLAGVAAHPPVVKVRDGGVTADGAGDSGFACKEKKQSAGPETTRQTDTQ